MALVMLATLLLQECFLSLYVCIYSNVTVSYQTLFLVEVQQPSFVSWQNLKGQYRHDEQGMELECYI